MDRVRIVADNVSHFLLQTLPSFNSRLDEYRWIVFVFFGQDTVGPTIINDFQTPVPIFLLNDLKRAKI